MENCDNLTLASAGVPGGAIADTLASSLKGLAGNIRNKSKLKTAQANLAAGRLNDINSFSVNLLIGAGVRPEVYTKIPAFINDPANAKLIADLAGGDKGIIIAKNADGTSPAQFDIKKYIPYIIGVIVIGVLIYFIVKK